MSGTEYDALSRAAVSRLREERDALQKILKAVEASITFANEEEAVASGLGLPDNVAWAIYWANRGDLARALATLGMTTKDERIPVARARKERDHHERQFKRRNGATE